MPKGLKGIDSTDIVSEKNHIDAQPSTSSDRLIVINNAPQVQTESDYDIGAENDPKTFSQAISCKESNLWYDAMKDEMNSMASNGVWNLVELPDGAKSIGYKWVFKKKKDSLGNIERYKARLTDLRPFRFVSRDLYQQGFREISDERLFNLDQCLKNDLELEQMKNIPYASAI
ncbi:hypothetical protein AAG906_021781 [Vitis piasezkii]